MATHKREELVGTFDSERFRFDDGTMIGFLADGKIIKGKCDESGLIPGVDYRFWGAWIKHPKYGPQFAFEAFLQHTPATRAGVIEYIRRVTGLSEVRLHKLVDKYGAADALAWLKRAPEEAAKVMGLPSKPVSDAAHLLIEEQKFQYSKVALIELFVGRGFRHSLVDECVKKWGMLAAEKVKADPFCLLEERLPGCGFLTVDRLWCELGHPKDAIRRQVFCAWYSLHSDRSGSTWQSWNKVLDGVRATLTGSRTSEQALEIAIQSGWLVRRTEDGTVWIADAKRAQSEQFISKRLEMLL